MIRSIDTTPAAGPTHDSLQLKLLDTLVQKIIEALADNSCKVKVGDALRAIQLREKVAKKSEAEQIFWQMIEEIKAEGPPGSQPEFTGLQGQIHAAILPLRDCVKNAILPVKIITEAFNSTRSEQARLTTRRMCKLLAGMGFTMVKTSNGSSAIIWDDNLLPPPPPSEPPEGPCRSGCPSGLQGDAAEGGGVTRQSVAGREEQTGHSSPPKNGASRRSGCPSGLQGDAAESGEATRQSASPRQDFIQGIDVFPLNPPTPLPWETTESPSSLICPKIHPGSPPVEFSRRLALSSGRMNRMVHPLPGGEGKGPSSPLVGEELKSKGQVQRFL